MNNILAAIPAYNEEKYIGNVVSETKRFIHNVYVVDDASTDKTSEIAKRAGAKIVRHQQNLRYGGAVKSCFKIAKETGADVLVILDGDGQHDPKDIPLLLEPIIKGHADIVIGSRFLKKNKSIPLYRKFGINIITLLFNFGSSIKVTDSQSGFRAYNRRALDLDQLYENCMGLSVEVIIQARKKGLVIEEVPISVNYYEDSSTINPIVHGLSVALTVVKHRVKSMS